MLKRYVTEPGTETTDIIFDKAETGEFTISISLWNIGEALGVLDERRRKAWLTEEEFSQTLKNLGGETGETNAPQSYRDYSRTLTCPH